MWREKNLSLDADNSAVFEITAFNGHQLLTDEQQEVQKELNALKIKAEKGDIEAMGELAEFYLYGANRLLSKPRFLWIFKNLNPNTYKGLFLVWKEI
mgnify:CR=1 FL=1